MQEPKLSTYGFCRGEPSSMHAPGPAEAAAVSERFGGQLRPVIAPDERGGGPALGDEPPPAPSRVISVDPPAALDRQYLRGPEAKLDAIGALRNTFRLGVSQA